MCYNNSNTAIDSAAQIAAAFCREGEKNQMKAYFDSIEKEVPKQLQQVFLNRRDTAVITIDMHDGHLSTDPDCPCPSPRGREIIEPLNHFMNTCAGTGRGCSR